MTSIRRSEAVASTNQPKAAPAQEPKCKEAAPASTKDELRLSSRSPEEQPQQLRERA